MFKRLAGVLALMALLFCAQPIGAQESEKNPYEPFQINVPAGWKASYNPGSGRAGQSLKLASPDGLALFSIEIHELKSGQWDKMIEDMSVRPAPEHGPPNMQSDDSFVVTFNDSATGLTGRKIYQRIGPKRDLYAIQTASGFHEDLPALLNSTQINLPE